MESVYTISAFTENSPGVLHRLTAVFTRRKVNVESLTVSETEQQGISRFTIVVKVEPELINKVVGQIQKIIEVRTVYASENEELVFKEIAFVRVRAEKPETRRDIEHQALRYGAAITFADIQTVVVEKTGSEDEINSLFLLLEPFGIDEFIRSGRIAIRKERIVPILNVEE